MSKWSLRPLDLELKDNWVISRGQSLHRKNYIVEFSDDSFKGLGEIAFLTGKGTTESEVVEAFDYFLQSVPRGLDSYEELNAFLEEHHDKLPNNLRIGIEQAFLSYIGHIIDQDIAGILGIKSCQRVAISYSLPIMEASQIKDIIENNKLTRFSCLKLKVNPEKAEETLKSLEGVYEGRLIIDANESFKKASEVIELHQKFPDLNIAYWEQPFAVENHAEYYELAKNSEVKVMADESLTTGEVTEEHAKIFQAVNVKLVKSGSFLKALKQIQQAKKLGMQVMLGCMIESSLGISRALQVGGMCDFFDLDSFLLIKDDPFKLVYEEKGFIFQSKYQ